MSLDSPHAQATIARRAFVTLVLSASTIYRRSSNRADYLKTVIPLLCSHRRLRSSYPLVVMSANLTASEESTLLAHGAHSVVPVTAFADRLRAWWAERIPPRLDCSLECGPKDAYCYSGRGDLFDTIVKFAVWGLAFDEVVYVDADSVFVRNPDPLFAALRGSGGGDGACTGVFCGSNLNAFCKAHKRSALPPCASLDFAAGQSGRFTTTTRLAKSRGR